MLNNIKNYVLENNFKAIYTKNQINIVNYQNIDHFDTDKIMVTHTQGTITIKGEKLAITKLLNDEMLITGKIKTIEIK